MNLSDQKSARTRPDQEERMVMHEREAERLDARLPIAVFRWLLWGLVGAVAALVSGFGLMALKYWIG